ncbi:ParA family protein [Granulicella sp. L60]|uniref:ParA family protein n=1 Tax=Granulicella sp. L60 TaxID=1641866 RepID=UPI00131C820C|nr:hypothetical protein [Granulicella sp. L60]
MKAISILTWLDLEFILESYRAENGSPNWLLASTVYQDVVDLEILRGTDGEQVDSFLNQVFGVRYLPDRTIALDSGPDQGRLVIVHVNEVDDSEKRAQVGITAPPSFRRVAALPDSGGQLCLPDSSSDDSPQIIAFYSFKGGVGRTTHLLAYLQALSSAREKRSALVIDADLEAPGITSLLSHEISVPAASLSFIDLLALIQSDPSAEANDSLNLATHLTRRQVLTTSLQEGDAKHYFIPAFRSEEQAMRLDIRPEHLTNRPGQEWSLRAFLVRLAKSLDVDVILLDLRAGYSELSSPFLFDPRIKKMLVTTPSIQSVDGTITILQQLGKIARRAKGSGASDPTVILSFVLAELSDSEFIRNIVTRLQQNYPELEIDESWPSVQTLTTPFSQELLYLDSFSEALTKLGTSPLVRKMSDLVEFDLPSKTSEIVADPTAIDDTRRRLTQNAKELEYAESGKGDGFLRIAPLRALARQYSGIPPTAVIIGAKGAGKTYTYLQILRAGSWSAFITKVNGETVPQGTALWPVLNSRNLDSLAMQVVETARTATANNLGITLDLNLLEISDLIRNALRETEADETWWRHKWFEIFAASMGLPIEPFNAAAGMIVDYLRKLGQQLVLMIDGLEDLFPELATNHTEQLALRALIQGVPSYLKSVPDSPLGVLIFVRADLARAAVPQNYGQFSRLYDAFALQWSEEEALRLAVWLADSAGVKRPDHLQNPPELLSVEEAKESLLAVWGRKLGTEKSREARSAEWVIAALSDFKGQIQARDLVRFLHFAAEGSIESANMDRVLSPGAIRNAIKPCSLRKIEEIEQEIPQLKAIFLKLQSVADLRIPFDATDANLTSEDIRFLQSVGVVAELHGEYYMPEIFRFGLGLRLSDGARPKVLSFARRFA